MSQHLSAVQTEQFDSEVKHAYQGAKTLRDCITFRNADGGKYDFRLMGKGQATQRTGASADVTPMGIDHSLIVATLLDYEASEYTDIYNAAAVNFDEVAQLANTIAYAMGRRDDQSIIDAMEAGASATPVGAGTQALDLATITAAAKALNKVEAPMEDRFMVVHEGGLNQLLNDSTITSADYNSVRLLMTGEIDSFMGFKWKIIGSGRAEGGLPLATTVRSGYAFQKAAVGHAVGIDMKTDVDWVPHKKSHLSSGSWKAGSVVIDSEGVIQVKYLES